MKHTPKGYHLTVIVFVFYKDTFRMEGKYFLNRDVSSVFLFFIRIEILRKHVFLFPYCDYTHFL